LQLPKFLQTIYNQASSETKNAIFAFDEVARNFKSVQGDISQSLAAVERSLKDLFDSTPEQADSIKRKLKNYLNSPSQDNPYQQLSKSKDQLIATGILDQTADQQGFPRSQSPQPQASAELVFSNDVKDLRDDGTRDPDSWKDDADEEGIAPQDRSPLSPSFEDLDLGGDNYSDYGSDSDAESILGGDLQDFITGQVFSHNYKDSQVNQQEKSAEIEKVVELVKSINRSSKEEDENIKELFEKVCNLFDNSKDKNQKVQSINAIVGEIAKELNDERGIKLLGLNNSYQQSNGNQQRDEFLRPSSPGLSDDEGDGPALSRSPSPSPGTRSTSRDRQPLSRPRNLSTDSNCIVS
ncbi:MAG: hypothetical protein ACKO7P_12665, partial [Bacteroidota bacterium]